MTQRRQLVKALAATPAAILASSWTAARAQGEYPARPIRLVVPFAAGSTPDVFARIVGDRASQGLKQPVVIENRSGAGGNLGTDVVAKAAPDGYTIGASITGPLVNNSVLYRKMPYDPFRDLAPITFGVHQANVIAVTPSLGVNTLRELMDLLRRNPGKYNYASIGVGSLSHLSMEMLKSLTHSFVVHVPYNSSPAAVTSVLQGDTHMTSLAPLAVMPQVQAGKLKALAVSTAHRVAQLPDVPTLREAGVPMDGSAWIGLVAPAGTPAPVIERLNHEFVAAMRDPATREKLKAQYMDAEPGTPAQFAAFMKAELAKWGPVIKRSGATID
ncbi:Bug family tripartite tricarboxylate transporter substrate binding protein [Ramlibacter alkalitolerans]|uniref:Bug family tripartite tricarboxylate transporter substrate binding protein n=1 Tax=Ramlibacter alkalitolerans TaxID=2039631 RepID=UPI002ED2101D